MKSPSRRHDSLIPLSRQHQHALLLCMRIHRGLIEHPADSNWLQLKADHSIRFYEGDLVTHFQAEEEFLFPAMLEIPAATEIVDELRAEHSQMRRLVDQLRQIDIGSIAATLKEFADTLEAHIRKEERKLFPIYEQQASPETIARVERAIVSLIGSGFAPNDMELLS